MEQLLFSGLGIEDERWKQEVARLKIQVSRMSIPVVIRAWRELYRKTRTPCDDNNEFYLFSCAILGVKDAEEISSFEFWIELMQHGVCDLLAEMAGHEDMTDQKHKVMLELMLQAFVVICTVGAQYENTGPEFNQSLWPGILKTSLVFWNNLYANRQALLRSPEEDVTSSSDLLRRQVILALQLFARVADPSRFPAAAEGRNVLRLMIFLWFHQTPQDALNWDSALAVETLITRPYEMIAYISDEHTEAAYEDFLAHDILGVYGTIPFLKRLAAALNYSGLVDEYLQTLICRGMMRFAQQPGCMPHLHESGVLLALRQAYDRQLERARQSHGKDSEAKSIYGSNICVQIVLIYWEFTKATPVAEAAGPLIRKPIDIVYLISCAMFIVHQVLFDANLANDDVLGLKSVSSLIRTCASYAEALNLRTGKNKLRKALKQSLKENWYRPIAEIRELAIPANKGHLSAYAAKALEAWRDLGQRVGLVEEEEKLTYEREQLKRAASVCGWSDCAHHATVDPGVQLLICKGCAQAWYCGKECQRRDWKEGGHRVKCRRLTQ